MRAEVERRDRQEAEARAEQERRDRQEAEQRAEEIGTRTRKTTLPDFLDACHIHLSLGLAVQDATLSNQGNPSNATNELHPNQIQAWKEFPAQQELVWRDLMDSDFVDERHFTSLHTLQESGATVRERLLSSEFDLNHFERSTVEDHGLGEIRESCQYAPLGIAR